MTLIMELDKSPSSEIYSESGRILVSQFKSKVDSMYVNCIVGNSIIISFLSFSLSACSTRQLFLNSPRMSSCPDMAY